MLQGIRYRLPYFDTVTHRTPITYSNPSTVPHWPTVTRLPYSLLGGWRAVNVEHGPHVLKLAMLVAHYLDRRLQLKSISIRYRILPYSIHCLSHSTIISHRSEKARDHGTVRDADNSYRTSSMAFSAMKISLTLYANSINSSSLNSDWNTVVRQVISLIYRIPDT